MQRIFARFFNQADPADWVQESKQQAALEVPLQVVLVPPQVQQVQVVGLEQVVQVQVQEVE